VEPHLVTGKVPEAIAGEGEEAHRGRCYPAYSISGGTCSYA
jgi:hypothetical protein